MTAPDLVIGIDGGGTCTRATLATGEGVVLGCMDTAGCNYRSVGIGLAIERIELAVRGAFRAANRAFAPPAAMFVGAAGVNTAEDARTLGDALCAAGLARPEQLAVANDSENAHAAGLRGRPGVALICGTGSIALGRSAAGRSFICGGRGWVLDDAASGAWLGLQALRAVVRAIDGREPATALQTIVLKALDLGGPEALVGRVYAAGFGAAEMARLAPFVLRAARQGDAVARDILQRGATEAAKLVQAAARGAGIAGATEVVLMGGVARSGPPYQPMIEAAIRRVLPPVTLVEPEMPPAIGAVIRALELARVPITPAVIERLKQSAPAVSIPIAAG